MLATTLFRVHRAGQVRRSAWAALLVTALAGCSSEPSDTTFQAGLAQTGCGPTDGPAVEIHLALTPAVEPTVRPNLQVMVYRTRADAAGHRWRLEASLNSATASYCPEIGTCESATGGTVRLDPTTSIGTVSGTIEARFETKGIVKGRFQAEWRDRVFQCG